FTIDNTAPTTVLTVQRVTDTANYIVKWNATDNQGGSGVKTVSIYVAIDGGDYQIWQRQLTDATGQIEYRGREGHTYQFLALATTKAGNREQPTATGNVPDDGSGATLGSTPVVDTTPPNFGQPPPPSTMPSTNPLFVLAQAGVPSQPPIAHASEFTRVLS